MYPGVVAIKCTVVLRRRVIFVEEQRRRRPLFQRLAHPVPIGAPVFWEDENNRPAFVLEISIRISRLGTYIQLQSLVESVDSGLGGFPVVVFGFVVEEGNLKILFVCDTLHRGEILI